MKSRKDEHLFERFRLRRAGHTFLDASLVSAASTFWRFDSKS